MIAVHVRHVLTANLWQSKNGKRHIHFHKRRTRINDIASHPLTHTGSDTASSFTGMR
jgi:DNA mismatch repair protein MutH